MVLDDLQAELSLDASGFTSGVDEAQGALSGLDGEVDAAEGSFMSMEQAMMGAGAGIAGAGAAIEANQKSTQDWRETLGRTGVAMDMTTQEVQALAASISDATFPMDDAVGTMDALAQIGVRNEDDMRLYAGAIDDIADATGSSATSIAEQLAPAVMALDGDLDGLADEADAFTLAARDSSLSIEDIASTIERLDFQELEDMGLSASDTAGLIAEFAEETGYSGRVLRSEFRQAMGEADGDLDAFTEQLGLGDDAMENWNERLEENEGITREYADAANEAVTPTDRLRQRADELRLRFAGMLGPLEMLGPALMGVGTIMMGLGATGVSLTGILGGAAGAVGGLGASFGLLLGPIGLVLLAVAALAAAFATDFMGIRTATEDAIARVLDALDPLISLLRDEFIETLEAWRATFEAVLGAIEILWAQHGEQVMAVVGPFLALLEMTIVALLDTLITAFTVFFALLRGDWEGAWDIIVDFAARRLEAITDFVTSWAPDFVLAFINALRAVLDAVIEWGQRLIGGSIIPDIMNAILAFIEESLTAIWDRFVTAFEAIAETIRTVMEGIHTFLTDVWAALLGFFEEVLQAIFDRVETAWTAIDDTVTAVTEATMSFLNDIWNALLSFMEDVLQAIFDRIETAWTAIDDTITAVTEAFMSFLADAWDALLSFLEDTLQSIYDAVETAWDAMEDVITAVTEATMGFLDDVWSAFLSFMEDTLQSIFDAVETAWDAMEDAITSITEDTMRFLEDVWDALLSFLEDTLQAIYDEVDQRFSDAYDTATGLVEDMRAEVERIFDEILEAVEQILGDVLEAIDSTLRDAVSAITGFESNFRSAGDALMSSFAEGIRAAGQRAVDAARRLAQRARDALPGSDAEEGPLSDLTDTGPAFVETFADGILATQDDLAGAAERAAAAAHGPFGETLEPDVVTPGGGRGVSVPAGAGAHSGATSAVVVDLLEEVVDVLSGEQQLRITDGTIETADGHTVEVVEAVLDRERRRHRRGT